MELILSVATIRKYRVCHLYVPPCGGRTGVCDCGCGGGGGWEGGGGGKGKFCACDGGLVGVCWGGGLVGFGSRIQF